MSGLCVHQRTKKGSALPVEKKVAAGEEMYSLLQNYYKISLIHITKTDVLVMGDPEIIMGKL